MKYKPILVALVILLSVHAQAQTKLTASYETGDASQFGYSRFEQGLTVGLSHRIKRWEPVATATYSNQHKAYVGNGYHVAASLGTRYYPTDRFFVTGGGNLGRDSNTQYTKIAFRGFAGGGVEIAGVRATATAFAPPNGLVSDPNTVRGITLLVEYEKALMGPFGLYTAMQGSVSSFNQTGGDPEARITGVVWRGRAGLSVTF